jgi:hypothetical protein
MKSVSLAELAFSVPAGLGNLQGLPASDTPVVAKTIQS